MRESFTRKLVRSWLKWARHMEKMEGNGCRGEWSGLEWREDGEEEDRD